MRVGEIIQTRSTGFVPESRQLHQPPAPDQGRARSGRDRGYPTPDFWCGSKPLPVRMEGALLFGQPEPAPLVADILRMSHTPRTH